MQKFTSSPEYTPETQQAGTKTHRNWRDTARNMMVVGASGCVLALALLTLDVPGMIIVTVLGVPAAISAWRLMEQVAANEAQLDARLATFQARWRTQFRTRRTVLEQRAYTGKTIRLDEVQQ